MPFFIVLLLCISLVSAGNVTVQAGDFDIDGNMTLGEKFTFALGEIIDNIVDGWITITGSLKVIGDLNITENVNADGNVTADYYFGDGSQLTNLPSEGNLSWNETRANGLYVTLGTKLGNTTAELTTFLNTNRTKNVEFEENVTADYFVGDGSYLSGIPSAGSEGELQFNEAGALAADANLTWDNVNKRLGIGVAIPSALLEVRGIAILGDRSRLWTNAAPVDTRDIVNKKYVDDNVEAATKEFWVIPSRIPHTGTKQFHPVSALSDVQELYFSFILPADFTSLTSAVVVIAPDTTEEIQYDLGLSYSPVGEAYSTGVASDMNKQTAVTASEIAELDASGVFGDAVASDYCGLRFASDTSTLYVLGLRIKYT